MRDLESREGNRAPRAPQRAQFYLWILLLRSAARLSTSAHRPKRRAACARGRLRSIAHALTRSISLAVAGYGAERGQRHCAGVGGGREDVEEVARPAQGGQARGQATRRVGRALGQRVGARLGDGGIGVRVGGRGSQARSSVASALPRSLTAAVDSIEEQRFRNDDVTDRVFGAIFSRFTTQTEPVRRPLSAASTDAADTSDGLGAAGQGRGHLLGRRGG